MHSPRVRLIALFFLLCLPALACNMPRRTPTPSQADLLFTAAAQTVQAQLTQVSQPLPTMPGGTPEFPTPISTFPLPATSTLVSVTQTPLPSTPTPLPCVRIKFVRDVTYPDNSEVSPGSTFVKTWRLQNDGSCTWTEAYALVFVGGDAMGAPASQPLPGQVAPGQTVDVSVSLTAPLDGGTYRGDFKLRNASNALFGLGDANKPFFVQIKVPLKTGLLYDFLTEASKADWTSGVGDGAGAPLAFGGADDDPNGAAKIKDGVKLESGATSSKILFTVPRHENNGYVSGLYPAYTVQQGDHFKANLGFAMNPGDVCGAGNAVFQLYSKEGDTLRLLGEWGDKCDGKMLTIDVDLSSLKGKTVRFSLVVKAGSTFSDDWAIWNSPRIVH